MSRSYRHTPISGISLCRSEKDDKRASHARFRSLERAAMLDPDEDLFPRRMTEALDPWVMGKDGKSRFDPDRFPEDMRK